MMMRDFGRWVSSDNGFFSATRLLPCGGRLHMVVELLPGGGWDWSAWMAGGSDPAVDGREDTLSRAVAAVEGAAETLVVGSPRQAQESAGQGRWHGICRAGGLQASHRLAT